MTSLKNILENFKSPQAFVIIGFGVTGQSLAAFFTKRQQPYFIYDEKLSEHHSPFFCGFIDAQYDFKNSAYQVVAAFLSPGISVSHDFVTFLSSHQNIPLFSEIELASLFLAGKFIGVTGTNGKSTVVTLIYELLKNSGKSAGLYGNIGQPLIEAVDAPPCDYYVIEESSYQLELVGSLRHFVAICLNVTDDHLDRYVDLNHYAQAKGQILKNSTATDYFIYNADDLYCTRMARLSDAQSLPFSLVNVFKTGAYTTKTELIIQFQQRVFSFDMAACALKGMHNHENMLAALQAVLLIDSSDMAVTSYRKTLSNFKGLPHRVEKVFSINGIDFYDDSKATNVGAVVMALASFSGPLILFLGGKDKGGEYLPLKGLVKAKVKHLFVFGEARQKLYDEFVGLCPLTLTENLTEAFTHIKKNVASGDVVLFSPACASFDQYKNYKERGDHFVKLVKQTFMPMP